MAGPSESVDTLRWRVGKLEDSLGSHEDEFKSLDERITRIEIELGKISIKMGIWAAIGASLPVVAAYILQLLK